MFYINFAQIVQSLPVLYAGVPMEPTLTETESRLWRQVMNQAIQCGKMMGQLNVHNSM